VSHILSISTTHGVSMKKVIDFDKDLQKAIQDYADLFCEGNFNMAVRQLTKSGLNNKGKV